MGSQNDIQRTVLPIPDRPRSGLVTYHGISGLTGLRVARQWVYGPGQGRSVGHRRGCRERRSPRVAGGSRPHCDGPTI